MKGWTVEAESEVDEWLDNLDNRSFDIAKTHINLLERLGSNLRMPHSRSLSDGLFELRFDMNRRAWRITYWFTTDQIIVLLTVFAKQRNNERAEVQRARTALIHCQQEHQE